MLTLSKMCALLVNALAAAVLKNHGIENPLHLDPDKLQAELDKIRNTPELFAEKSSAFTEDDICRTAFKAHFKYIEDCTSGKITPLGTDTVTDDTITMTVNHGKNERREEQTDHEPVIDPEQPLKKLMLAHGEIKSKYPESIVIVRDHEKETCHIFGDEDSDIIQDFSGEVNGLKFVSEEGFERVEFPITAMDELIPKLVLKGHKIAFAENELTESVITPDKKKKESKGGRKLQEPKVPKEKKAKPEPEESIENDIQNCKTLEELKKIIDHLVTVEGVVKQLSSGKLGLFMGCALNENRGKLFVAIKFEDGSKAYPFIEDFNTLYSMKGLAGVHLPSISKMSPGKTEEKTETPVVETEEDEEEVKNTMDALLSGIISKVIEIHKTPDKHKDAVINYLTESVGKSREKRFFGTEKTKLPNDIQVSVKYGINLMFESQLMIE